MTRRYSWRSHGLAALILGCWLNGLATAATPHNVPWSTVATWPDFTGGVWVVQRGGGPPRDNAPLKADIAARLKAQGPVRADSLGSATCTPTEGPFERTGQFFYSNSSIFIMADDDYLSVRRIYMDGRDHGDPDPTYFGHSIGHWEGDTLVVDTVGFLPEVWVAMRVPGNGATHAIERFRLTGADELEHSVTLVNPEVFTSPYTTTEHLKRRRDIEVQEAFCSQNNRDAPIEGKPNLDLTPPKS